VEIEVGDDKVVHVVEASESPGFTAGLYIHLGPFLVVERLLGYALKECDGLCDSL